MIMGDYNGHKESSLFAEQVTHYKLIKQYLNLSDGQFKVKPNPKQAKNSTHVNNVLAHFPITIHSKKGAGLIFDLENVKRRADGTIMKMDRDEAEQQADLLDCWRYFCNVFLDWFDPIVYAKQLPQWKVEGVVKQEAAITTNTYPLLTKENYSQVIRAQMIIKVEGLINDGDTIAATELLDELQRLDKLYEDSE